jgi:hypothetical protein
MNRFFVVLAFGAFACTEVRVTDDDGGGHSPSPGSGGDGSGAMVGGAGGSGGDGCVPGALKLVGEPAVVPLGDVEVFEHSSPRLVELDNGEVLLVLTARMTEGVWPRSPAFAPTTAFQEWPPYVPPPLPQGFGSTTYSEVGSSEEGVFILTGAPEGGLLLTGLPKPPGETVTGQPLGGAPDPVLHFAAYGQGNYLVRVADLEFNIVTTAWPAAVSEVASGACGAFGHSDAIAVGDGFLVSERFSELQGNICEPASEVSIVKYVVSPSGELVRTEVQEIPAGADDRGVMLVDTAYGVWLLVEAVDGSTIGHHLDADGQSVGEPVSITSASPRSHRAAARLGGGFASVRFGSDDSDPLLQVSVHDGAGALTATSELTSPYASLRTAAALASTSTDALLVAFSALDGSGQERVVLARFTCTGNI